jgi:putative PEP-CTERM system histidine kinase
MPDASPVTLLHAACAAVYLALLLLLALGRPVRTGLALAGACGVTAVWAGMVAAWPWLAVDGGWPAALGLLRGLAWYGVVLHLYRRSVSRRRQHVFVFTVTIPLALLAISGVALAPSLGLPARSALLLAAALQTVLAANTVLLVENFYLNTPRDYRWHVKLLCIALGLLAVYDLMLGSDTMLFARVSEPLFAGRASAALLAAPLLAVAAARDRRWKIDIHVSRTVAFHSASLVGSGVFLLSLAVAGEAVRRTRIGLDGAWGIVAELSLLLAGGVVVALLLFSGAARSMLRRTVVENFYSSRFDYRREWMRCIGILSGAGPHEALATRAVRAVAGMVDSPGGVLLLRDGGAAAQEDAFRWAASWNLPAVGDPVLPTDPVIGAFRDGAWIIELAAVPRGLASAAEWPDLPRLWLGVPLRHGGRMIGFVLLARPRIAFRLDREVFDLLRNVGQEVASHLAEAQARRSLDEAQQLRAHAERFAFVVHDVKNVAGQLSMLLSNAEHHAQDPEFQRDVLRTVEASVARIRRMLARLEVPEAPVAPRPVRAAPRLRALAECAHDQGRTVRLSIAEEALSVAIDPAALDAVLAHLLDNAFDATPSGEVSLALRRDAAAAIIEVIDGGAGMSAEFLRDRLFAPFASTKPGGHGIGAYQARELVRAAGGELLALSRPGAGTTMRIVLPAAAAATAPAAGGDELSGVSLPIRSIQTH